MHSGLMFFGAIGGARVMGTVTASTAITTDMSLDLSSIDVKSGDLILVAAACGSSSITFLPMVTSGFATLLQVGADDTNSVGLAIYYKVADGAETTIVVDSGGSTFEGKAAIAYVLRTFSDIEGQSGSVSNTAVPPQVSITSNNRLAVCFFACGTTSDRSFTNSSLDDFQSVYVESSSKDVNLASGYKPMLGSFTPAVCGVTGDSTADSAVAVTIAV